MTIETLASFWSKLQLDAQVRVTYEDTYRNKRKVSTGSIVTVQKNAVARDAQTQTSPKYSQKKSHVGSTSQRLFNV